jgi:hypothetical protein
MQLIDLINEKASTNRPFTFTDLGIHLDGILRILLSLLDFV